MSNAFESKRDPSSFRDFEGYVFFDGEKVKRNVIVEDAQKRMQDLLMRNVFSSELRSDIIPSYMKDSVMEHERVDIVTYPYEWSFSMLLDASLCQLRIMKKLIPEGFILKDGSAFNCMYHNGRMVFIDILSIDYIKNQTIWDGYHQFL